MQDGLPSTQVLEPIATPDATRRILIVDNNASTRRFLSTALAAEGGCVISAMKDAAETLSALASASFDLIVCDLMLPDVSGCELITRLRKDGVRAPILILSSTQDELSLTHALAAGADDYLQKPVDIEELRRAIATLLARSTERISGRDKHVPLHGGTIAVRTFEEGSFVELTASTNSAQIESFQRLSERLVGGLMTQTDRVNLRLALEEMIQNAKEWGNRFNAAKKVRLAYCLLPDRVVFRIEDEGDGFEPYSVPDPSIDPRAHIKNRLNSGKRIGGWGLFMTRKLMDEVVFNGAGNVVLITKKFRRANPDSGVALAALKEQDVVTPPQSELISPDAGTPVVKDAHVKTKQFTSGRLPWTK